MRRLAKQKVESMFNWFVTIAMYLFCSLACADDAMQPLPAEQAFPLRAVLNNHQLALQWNIAPGYYLYRNQLVVATLPSSAVKIDTVLLPNNSTPKKDKLQGNYQVYSGQLKVPVELSHDHDQLDLLIQYQGCSEYGFCYPPIQKQLHVNISQVKEKEDLTKYLTSPDVKLNQSSPSSVNDVFAQKSQVLIILSFFGLGLLLAFTPCVLPMVPILSGIIIGLGHHVSVKKAFMLSLFYVIGMSVTYAAAGMLVALAGSHVQIVFQQTWIIVLFSGLFVALAFSLFGYFELELPVRWQRYITAVSNQQKGGTYIGVFFMGVLSTLIVSPCVSAPLVGVLTYIAQTGDVWLGGATLLAMGLGMGAPLLLLGMSAGKLLPKTGSWMESVKKLFGIMMLGLAVWMLSRVIPGPVALALWSVLTICTAVYLGVFSESKNNWQKISRGLGVFLLIYGVILMSGAALGNANPLRPWEETTLQHDLFVTIQNQTELEHAFIDAKTNHQSILLDFYADWCVSCIKMDEEIFTRVDVKNALKSYALLRIDVTHNSEFDQAMLKKFNVIAPPTIVIFDREGKESQRVIGEISSQRLIEKLK